MHSHGMRQTRPLSVTQIFKGQPKWILMTSRWSVLTVSHRGCTRTASQAQRLILPSPHNIFVRDAPGSGACPANRFFLLTHNSDVVGQVEAPTSDRDSLEPPRNRKKRPRLNWNPKVPMTDLDPSISPDSTKFERQKSFSTSWRDVSGQCQLVLLCHAFSSSDGPHRRAFDVGSGGF